MPTIIREIEEICAIDDEIFQTSSLFDSITLNSEFKVRKRSKSVTSRNEICCMVKYYIGLFLLCIAIVVGYLLYYYMYDRDNLRATNSTQEE